jgi:hypothetical protein
MVNPRPFPVFIAGLLAAGVVAAQVPDGQWVSYREAYRAMVAFEKYGAPKQLIQQHYQVSPRERATTTDGVQLTLEGKTSHVRMALDPLGRSVFPLLKAAYDENAALVLNRRQEQFVLHPRISLQLRADGVYEAAELRAACEQALQFQRSVDGAYRARSCVGVRFSFASKGEALVRVRRGGAELALAVGEGAAFADDAREGFQIVGYRFADALAGEKVLTPNAPLAIAPLYE